MNETFEFLAEGDRFWSWLESDETTAEELESYANTGDIPAKPSRLNFPGLPGRMDDTKTTELGRKRDFDLPPPGNFMQDSVWFHPQTQEKYVYKSGVWVCNPDALSTEDVRKAAKLCGVRTYYNSLTRQFVFSFGEESRAVDRDFFKDVKTSEDLNKYFEWMVATK